MARHTSLSASHHLVNDTKMARQWETRTLRVTTSSSHGSRPQAAEPQPSVVELDAVLAEPAAAVAEQAAGVAKPALAVTELAVGVSKLAAAMAEPPGRVAGAAGGVAGQNTVSRRT